MTNPDVTLLVSLLALLFGPLVYGMARRRGMLLSLLDGFIFIAISGMVLLYILPESFLNGGWFTLLFALAGLFVPTVIERGFRGAARQTHIATMALGLAGICLHGLIDGTALAPGQHLHGENATLLPYAVILHRLPVGLTIWWLLRPAFGVRVAATVLGMVGLATITGFSLGPYLTAELSGKAVAWFQALVAGSLLHVVFHQPHLDRSVCGCRTTSRGNSWWEGTGALLGLLLLAVLITGDSPLQRDTVLARSLDTFLVLALEIAPVLLLAYFMAGMMNAFLPHSSIGWMKRGSPWAQSARGMAVGLPFPVCSCGVVPLYQTLVRKGAPTTAAMAFLIATPELGLDAVLVSIPLLGTELTLLRVAAAALVALLVGRFVGMLVASSPNPLAEAVLASGDETPANASSKSLASRVWSGIQVGLGDVVDYTAPWILVGLAIAAVAHPFLEGGWLRQIPNELQVPLFALLGLPTYVCASGATPLVAVLLFSGVSPGAALAFLLTGPATNVTTFGLLGRLHGRKTALSFSLTIIGLAVCSGYLVNLFFPGAAHVTMEAISESPPTQFDWICLFVLSGTFLFSVLRRGARHFVGELFFHDERAMDLNPHYH